MVWAGGGDAPFTYVSRAVFRLLKGGGIKVNLTPDKRCNFRCVYCGVDRSTPAPEEDFNPVAFRGELNAFLERMRCEGELGGLRYIALAGQGEPTSCVHLPRVAEDAVAALMRYGVSGGRVALMTNGTCLHTPWAMEALAILRKAGGEIWVKLDAGSQEYLTAVTATPYPIEALTDKIVSAGRAGEIMIQSLFFNKMGQPPSRQELSAYVARVKTIRARGGRIKRVSVRTLARPLAGAAFTPVSVNTLKAIAGRLEGEAGVSAGVV